MTVADQLIATIRDKPQNCIADRYYFKVDGAVFWVASGFTGFVLNYAKCEFPAQSLTFLDRLRVYRAFCWWCRHADLNNFKKVV